MRFHQALGEVVRERRLATGITMRSIVDNGYLSLGYLSEIERGLKEPSSAIIEQIANGLGLEPYELIMEASLKMYRLGMPDVLYVPDNQAWRKREVASR